MNRFFLIALLAVACAKPEERASTADSIATSKATAVAAKTDSLAVAGVTKPAGLAGTKWKLLKFTGGNDSTKVPSDPNKYTIAFGADGKVAVQADCNRGSGTWSSPEGSTLKFSQLATTMAACPPESMSNRFLGDFQHMTSYMLRNGHLYISLMADAGIYEFEPAS